MSYNKGNTEILEYVLEYINTCINKMKEKTVSALPVD